MISVAAALITENDKILAARKKPGLPRAGLWEFPGGKIEPGETAPECLQRELLEEFDADFHIGQYIGESEYNYGDVHIRLLCYHAVRISGQLCPKDHDRITWLLPAELSELNWAPADQLMVEKFLLPHAESTSLAYYNTNPERYIRHTRNLDMTAIQRQFMLLLAAGAHILDAGCGSGRDSKAFLDHGYSVTPLDGSEHMAAQASRYLGLQVEVTTVQQLAHNAVYNGIWACAVMVHIPAWQQQMVIANFERALKPDGVLYFSCRDGNSPYWDQHCRYINPMSRNTAEHLITSSKSLELIRCFSSTCSKYSEAKPWWNVLARKRA